MSNTTAKKIRRPFAGIFKFLLLLAACSPLPVLAADQLQLKEIKPAMACEALLQANVNASVDEPVTLQTAELVETAKGRFCKVTGHAGTLPPFELYLPAEHWHQRLLETSSNLMSVPFAGSCTPAVNGEFAVALNTQNFMLGGPAQAGPAAGTPRPRVDYRGRHLTAQAAKALIKLYYGQPQRYAYFTGCSVGGGQALNEAERYPEDFDGIAAGSPLILPNVHNIFFHPWESTINRRADGSRILASSKLAALHQAVLAHCAAGAGLQDDLLQQPTACQFKRAWVQCKSGASDTANCLTSEEADVVEKLYEGPGDGAGHRFELAGFAMGSELVWGLSTAEKVANPEANIGPRLKQILEPPEGDQPTEVLLQSFGYTMEWFGKVAANAAYANSANTNLAAFQKHGGKLLLWNGGEDLIIQPEVAVAYYQGVQKTLGVEQTDKFMRLFMIPGFGHCLGGELALQFDVLTPLMAWTEQEQAPEFVLSSKTADGKSNPSPFEGKRSPLATADRPNAWTRPVFRFPFMAQYTGKGDANDPKNYRMVRSAAPVPQRFDSEAARLIGPDNQKSYEPR